MKKRAITVCFAALFLTGCVPSLHRLYDDRTTVSDAKLPGRWIQEDGDATWTFEADGEGYTVQITEDDGKTGRFEAHLVRLEDLLFMDLYPGELDKEMMSDLYAMHLVPAHTFWRMHRSGDEMSLRMLNPEAVDDMLKADPDLIKHETPDDGGGIILTAGTAELQRFVVRCAKTEDGFGDPMILARVKGFCSKEKVIFDAKLVGRWKDDDEQFDCSADENVYHIRLLEDGRAEGTYTAVLINLKDLRFWAVYAGTINPFQEDRLLTPELLMWIERVEPTLQLREIDGDDVQKALDLPASELKQLLKEETRMEYTRVPGDL